MSLSTKETSNSGIIKSIVILIIVTYVMINMVFIYYIGPYAWDDGAITLAFGQTLGEYGRFSLTRVSEIVEGSSSIFLVLLSALVTKLFHLGFYELIAWSQINTLVFTIFTLILTYKLLESKFKNQKHALSVVILLSVFPMYATEIMNGMEMTIFSTFLLLLLICHEHKSKWVFLIIPLLLLTRYESIFYLIFTYTALFLFNKDSRKEMSSIIIYTLAIFILLSFLRYLYFDDFLPNTIWAKMHPPYTPTIFLEKLSKKIYGGLDFLYVFNFIIIGSLLFMIKKDRKSEMSDIKLWLIISFFIFSLIVGRNLGYIGRMTLPILPIIVIFLVTNVLNLTSIRLQTPNQTRGWSLNGKSKLHIILFTLLIALLFNSPLFISNIKKSLTGGFFQNRYLPKIVDDKFSVKYYGTKWFGVTPENYKITGMNIEQLRDLLDLSVINFMAPDVGGLGLCCNNINIIDSALLTNKYLAKNGYSNYDKYLRSVNPDIIETHGIWSQVTDIYSSTFFKENFLPIIFNNNFLWLNSKHLSKLLESHSVNIKQILKYEIPQTTRYFFGIKIDKEFIDSYTGIIHNVNMKYD